MKKKRFRSGAILLIITALTLTACNLPSRQALISPTQPAEPILQNTPTPTPACANPFFPNTVGDKWEYSGTNSLLGEYTRTDSITNSSAQFFTQDTSVGQETYSVTYDCAPTGLTSRNPIQQFAGALLNTPDAPVTVNLSSNSGTSLPAQINPGDNWQQTADFDASSQQINVNGRIVSDSSAAGYENITVPAGTYNALRVTTIIHIQVTSFHITAGSYTITSWWAPEVGMIKSEGSSQVPGVNFSDSIQLASFSPAP